MKKYLALYAQLAGVFLILLSLFLSWEAWTRGATFARTLENVLWYSGDALRVLLLCAIITAGVWALDFVTRRPGRGN